MTNTTNKTANNGRKSIIIGVLATLAFVVVGASAFLGFYNSYSDRTLYEERLSQMKEVTTQLFSGLEDVVQSQTHIAEVQTRTLSTEAPATYDELIELLNREAYLNDMNATQSEVVVIDANGACYTQAGRQGLLSERRYLQSSPETVSFVSNTMLSNETRMVFLKRLPEPITVQDGSKTITLAYCGVMKNMEQLNPYFNCSAYEGNNFVYVVDPDGLKLFNSTNNNNNNSDLVDGFNAYTALENMDYLHGTSFADAKAELDASGSSYSNAVINGTEVYYALYRMNNAEWTLLFMVPSQYVATNTVELVNTSVNLVLFFAVLLTAVASGAVFLVVRRQQQTALKLERETNESLAAINEQLSAAVETAERATQEAETANRAKSDFLSNMSHDIRTPMNAIVGITELMSHERDLSPKQRDYVHKVQLSSQHLLSLINDVLDMSKIESSDVTLSHAPISITEQVRQVESIVRPQAEGHLQTLTVSLHSIEHDRVIGDDVRLRQILINLLSNAVKYTPNGGAISLDVTELPSAADDCAQVRIVVADNGFGMQPEFVERIFEPFTRAESSTTNKIQGTGLGMAIAKSIVDLMGGSISVESEPNVGSTFTVNLTLPIDCNACENAPSADEIAPEVHDDGAMLAGMNFLCAEDNDLNAEILQAILELDDASCIIYPNGKEVVAAFEAMEPGQFDAILMDVQMPVMNGLEAARAIRASKRPDGRTIPIIAMTANAFSSDVQDCLDAGMNAHVAKPLEIPALERALRAAR